MDKFEALIFDKYLNNDDILKKILDINLEV